MTSEEHPTVEIIGALATSLKHALERASPFQLARLEADMVAMLQSVDPDSPSANVFRSVLRDIEERRSFLSRQ